MVQEGREFVIIGMGDYLSAMEEDWEAGGCQSSLVALVVMGHLIITGTTMANGNTLAIPAARG